MRIDESGIGLRKFEPRDAGALYLFRNDCAIVSQLGGFSTGYSMSELAAWIEYHNNQSDEVIYAIVNQNDDAVGHVGLYRIDHRIRKAEFAIVIGDTDWHGRGFGRVVSRWMINFGFLELNLNKITLTVLEENERARRLYTSLSFVEEGTMRQEQYRDGAYLNVVLLSLLREEWQAGRN